MTLAAETCTPAIGRISKVQGSVDVLYERFASPISMSRNDTICEGSIIRVGPASRVTIILFDNGGVINLSENAEITLDRHAPDGDPIIDHVNGFLHYLGQTDSPFGVITRALGIQPKGTEFLVWAMADRTQVIMLDGGATLRNPWGQIEITSGEGASANVGEAPKLQAVVRPRDAVAWALYYPPVQPELVDGGDPGSLSATLAIALLKARKNDYAGAFKTLDQASESERDARHEIFRAGLLLEIGKTERALAAIERALDKDPNAAGAYAQRSMIRVVGNQPGQALEDANRAVELDPVSSTALVAQSYARQANFDLEGARESLRLAVDKNPEDALAFARLYEIELSFGDLDRANDAADRAAKLAPYFGRTQMVKGFAELHKININGAIDAFDRAIALDQAEPLSRLGLGLAKIRQGELEAGRQELEIAASLDPNNSLIRSYLGKAYFEEKRDEPAAEEYTIAKDLDPNDPTPWFYDAIRKQLDNRPVEALHGLGRAIDRNDNRAVYRSRLLLDQDLAARSTSLARIYDDLGFDQLAVNEASRSLSLDPSNHSAHRFLSDAYARLPRHEIARVSELLQAQLLQPLSINPVPPSLTVSDLNVVSGGGPSAVGFNEFHPFFERNRVRAATAVTKGDKGSIGDEVIAAAVWDRLSFSAGQFYSDTDGFRENSQARNELYNLFSQFAVSPRINLQAEYRRRETNHGDLILNFDQDNFDDSKRQSIKQDIARIGARFSSSSQSEAIVSLIYTERNEETDREIFAIEFDQGTQVNLLNTSTREKGLQFETQYLLRINNANLVAGLGTYELDVHNEATTIEDADGVFGPPIVTPSERDFKRKGKNGYIYGHLEYPKDVTWTAGLSYTALDQLDQDIDRLDPKIGLEWQVSDGVRLRAAAFRNVKRALAADQTIEPTQIAGFNQFFDDFNGTKSFRYGVGLDARLRDGLYGGVEWSRRDREVPLITGGRTRFEERPEELYRSYLYWTPQNNWALAFGAEYDQFKSEAGVSLDRPLKVETILIPLTARFFNESGFFASVGTTFVHQNVKRSQTSGLASGSDEFIVLNASLGQRFSGSNAVVRLESENLLDTRIKFEDDNFRSSENSFKNSRFAPRRSILLRLTLNF